MSTTQSGPETVRQRLDAELEIVPPESCSCGVEDIEGDVVGIQQIRVGGQHHSDLTLAPDGERQGSDGPRVIHRRDSVGPNCPFQVFYDEGWVPRVTEVSDEQICIQVYLPDRESLSGVIDVLERTAAEFSVRRLRRIDRNGIGGKSKEVTFDLSGLTEKQRLTASRAVEAGYYDEPRETSLARLAQEMGISKSALSQRLRSVETKLLKCVFDETNR
jgi:hypothetical protein